MAKFIIQGGKPISGEIKVSGAKNQALKLVSLALLLKDNAVIRNVPDILDIRRQIKIAKSLGLGVGFSENTVRTSPGVIKNEDLDRDTAGLLRSSIVFWGPLLALTGRAQSPYPGGCVIGARSIETHLDAFKQAGARVSASKDWVSIELSRPKDAKIILKEQSVSATENLLLYASGVEKKTIISNIAIEPEITDLIKVLSSCGAKIKLSRERSVEVIGTTHLSVKEIEVIPDRIEAASYAIALIVNGGTGSVAPFISKHNRAFIRLIEKAGANFEIKDNVLYVKKCPQLLPFEVKTAPFPGFPTDLQSPIALVAAKANGTSKIFETMYENRFGHLLELKKMGLNCEVISPHEAKIYGPADFKGAHIESLDLRSGITILLAALSARGETVISQAEIIDRGYESVETKLNKLGADIVRKND